MAIKRMTTRLVGGQTPDLLHMSSSFTWAAPILSSLSTVRMMAPDSVGQVQHGIEAVQNFAVVHPKSGSASGPWR